MNTRRVKDRLQVMRHRIANAEQAIDDKDTILFFKHMAGIEIQVMQLRREHEMDTRACSSSGTR